ncbi:MAG: DoxX family protein [Elusimicrobia bacterium]|nr:DoxX family protein [Elusimicrobiota bacterium]MDE2313078.1 DoxX family protein [Elusimicrobiota bacterium]
MEWEDIIALAGRLLIAALFLASAFGKITNFPGTVAYMEGAGMFWAPFFCAAAAALEAACGVALVLGCQARWAAAALAAYLIPVTWIFHLSPRVDLLKNLAIMGALLQIAAWGSGRLSLDGGSDED